MKYLHQALIIAAVTFAAELIKFLIPLPIPASIYGLILLFTLLKTGILKLSQIEDVGGLLLELMPLLLVPTSARCSCRSDGSCCCRAGYGLPSFHACRRCSLPASLPCCPACA